ncbi:MAG: arginase family protein [Bdellovibrionales bacterium]
METDLSFAFGNQSSLEQAQIILVPVPWELTSSYGQGSRHGPELIRKASSQLDFFKRSELKSYNHLIYFEKEDPFLKKQHQKGRRAAQKIQADWEENKILSSKEQKQAQKVNQSCEKMVDWVYQKSSEIYSRQKLVGLIGGDHSVSEGLLKYLGEKHQGHYGILHIDAHPDLRSSYQGFHHSHASIMNNALSQKSSPQKLIQVGIRDFSKEEYTKIEEDSRIHCYYDEDLCSRVFAGEPWAQICQEIISHLPQEVYISLDLDGLSWESSMGTGTPVPGGLSFNQAVFLLRELKKQNKTIIGFDLVETSAVSMQGASLSFQEWSGNVSARLIYEICGLALSSMV